MDSTRNSVRSRERPSSRGSSVGSLDGRRSSVWSRNSSFLPHSTRFDGSGFNDGEVSTLSRAMLHNTENERTEDSLQAPQTGWHCDPQCRAEEEEEQQHSSDRHGGDDEEGGRGSRVCDGAREEHGHPVPTRPSERHSSFRPTPFSQHRSSESVSAGDAGTSYVPRTPAAAPSRGSRHCSTHSDLGSGGTAASSLGDCGDAPSFTNSNSRAFRSGHHFFASCRRGEWAEDEDGSLHTDASWPHRRNGHSARGSAFASGSLDPSLAPPQPLHPRAASLLGSSADRLSALTPKTGRGASLSSLRRRRSNSTTVDGSLDGSGRLSSPAKRGTTEVDGPPLPAGTDLAGQTLGPDSNSLVYGERATNEEEVRLTAWDATPAAEDRVWPFTQPIEVRLIRMQVRQRLEWNHTMRQFLVFIPLLFLVSSLIALSPAAVSTNLFMTEALRQRFLRNPFPSAATAMEMFRQQQQLGFRTNIPTDRLFGDIRSQTDWMQYIADVVLPGAFPEVTTVLDPNLATAALASLCAQGSNAQSCSADGACFSDGRFWWDRPGCTASSSGVDWGVPRSTRGASAAGSCCVSSSAANGTTPMMPTNAAGNTDSLGSARVPCTSDEFLYESAPRVGPAQNVFLGAMRVRTIRMRPHTAKLQRSLYPAEKGSFPMDAWTRNHERSAEETTPERCPSITLNNPFTNETSVLYKYIKPEANDPYCIPSTGRFGSYHCGGYIVDVPFRSSKWRAAQYRAALRNTSCFFVDNWATRLAMVEFFTYTPDHDSFHMVKLRTEVLAGGSYHNEAVFRSFWVWTPARENELVYVSFTLAYVVFYFIILLVRLRWQVRWVGWFDTLHDRSIWMDLFLVTAVVVTIAHYYAWVQLSRKVAPQLALPMDSDVYPSYLDAVQALFNSTVVSGAFSVILCYTRIFFFRALFRPLSTIVTTLDLSLPTLFTAFVVFMLLVLGYALVAYAVFGGTSETYTTFGDALYSLVSCWYSISFVIPSEESVARQFTGLLFWSFTIVLFSMSVAIHFATVSHSFARIQAVYGAGYDALWLERRIRGLGQCCTWARTKWFLGKMVFLYPENDYLFSLLESMNTAYFKADGALGSRDADDGVCDSEVSNFVLRRAAKDVNAAPSHNEGRTSSVSSPTSFSAKARRMIGTADAAVVESPSTDSGTSTLDANEHDSEVAADTAHRPSQGPAFSPRTAVSSFSATEEGNPLSSAACTKRGAPTQSPNRCAARGISIDPLSRPSEALREICDELRELTTVQPRITFFDWCEVIPRDVFVKCGGMPYFKDWWRQLVEVQADFSRTPQLLAHHEFRAKVVHTTEREVAGGIVGIRHLENTLSQLELHVDSLLRNVSKR